MSDNVILAAMRRMGIGKDDMSGFGFRAMARTVLHAVRDLNRCGAHRQQTPNVQYNPMRFWLIDIERQAAVPVGDLIC